MSELVYVIGCANSSTVKIGVSDDPERRLRQIQYMSPVPLQVLWSGPGGNALERALHKHFAEQRSHGEWFTFTDQDPVEAVRGALEAGLRVEVPAQEDEPVPTDPPPFDPLKMAYGQLARFYRPGERFVLCDVAERFGYMEDSMRTHLDALVADGRARMEHPFHSSNWWHQKYSLRTLEHQRRRPSSGRR